jgi:ribonuclease HII
LKDIVFAASSKMLDYKYKNDDVLEVGVDEVARGCLFGRLYTGAVILPVDKDDLFDHGASLHCINDSKKLSKRKRQIVYDYVKEIALDWNVSFAEAQEIDDVNVLQADLACMRRSVSALQFTPGRILIDGDRSPFKDNAEIEYILVTKGDAKYMSIAAASIMAKVEHDQWINDLCAENPDFDTKYGLLSNMGYGTATHMKGLKEHGATSYHRRSFKPVAAVAGWSGE